jgi:type I restriction enzyme S subunit
MDLRPILEELKEGLQQIYGERLKGVYLFGSRARGDAEEDSDIDIAVVLDDFESEYREGRSWSRLASEIGLKYTCVPSLLAIREADWRARDDSFLRNVRREGVPV